MVEVRELFASENPSYWLAQIGKSDWGAGKFLHELLRTGELRRLCGNSTRVYLLADEKENLISFCTLAEEDDIRDSGLTPWVGFVYTFPEQRGHHYAGELLRAAYEQAREDGAAYIYISTNEVGLYEKYGYSFFKIMKDQNGEDSRVYRIKVGAQENPSV